MPRFLTMPPLNISPEKEDFYREALRNKWDTLRILRWEQPTREYFDAVESFGLFGTSDEARIYCTNWADDKRRVAHLLRIAGVDVQPLETEGVLDSRWPERRRHLWAYLTKHSNEPSPPEGTEST